ncbi:carboxylesterase [Choiromyces venosus 120613-1]|uniref:Carboxylic ester hydrolase n=1 Tax=Choiromyces venosus 120613-1 TaxID=1336337 RepID=A0A3N4JV72_9PEZI|nr:carboxylesterase [Choiromyces venosus 120613-1]
MHFLDLLSIALLLVLPAASQFTDPLAHLPYGDFQGKYDKTYNISYFRKIPFAAPPVGENRFRGPQPVVGVFNGTYDSNVAYDMCPQRTVNGSEDCLYLTLYSRPWREGMEEKRPVMVFFYGGGFIQGAAGMGLPPSTYPVMNMSVVNDYIAVYPNYRTNAFGFLPGRRIKESQTSDLNTGLLDQQAALKWVNENIQAFGGDPSNVTIWGQSAGGGSVVAQVLANRGATRPKLFQKAIASSPFWPRNYKYDDPEAEEIYDTLVRLTGCGDARDSLRCLKEVDVQRIRGASQVINAMHTYNTSSYTWAPVVDGEFLVEGLSSATAAGRVNSEVVMGVYNRFEGSTFVSSALNSTTSSGSSGTGAFNSTDERFRYWLKGFLPRLSERELAGVERMYPKAVGNGGLLYTTQQDRAGYIYRDLILACPAYWIAAGSKNGYIGEYTISPAKHASDVGYWNTVNSLQTTQPTQYHGFAGSFGNMIMSGNPNGYSTWPDVKSGEQWIMSISGFSTGGLDELTARCKFWRGIGGSVPV